MRVLVATLVLAVGLVAALELAWLAGSLTSRPVGDIAAGMAGGQAFPEGASLEGGLDETAAPPPIDPDWPPALAPQPGEIVAPAARNVTPPGFTSAPVVDGPLVRVESPRPDPVPRVRPVPRKERMFRVHALDAGRLQSGGGVIRLFGIAAPALDGTCGEGSAVWPCGRMARTALQRLIRGRAIECDVPFDSEDVPETATCSVAGTNLSAWLAENGWAKADEPRYAEAAEAARQAGRGIWGATRP